MNGRPELRRIGLYALRSMIAYIFYLLILRLTTVLLYARVPGLLGMGTFRTDYLSRDFDLPFDYAYILHMLIIPFLFYSISRLFALGDTQGFLNCNTDKAPRLATTLVTLEYRTSLAVTALAYLMFPLRFGMEQLRAWPDFAAVLGGAVEKVLFGIVLLPTYAFLLALAHRSVRREWLRIHKERQSPMYDRLGGLIGFLKDRTGLGGLIATLFLVFWLYPLGTFAASVLFAVLLPFLAAMLRSPLTLLIGLGIIAAIAALFLFPSYLRALFKRRRLMREVAGVCRRCGYELTVTGHPYLGLLRYHGDSDFSVKVNERQYDCKLLASVMPGGKMLFFYDGKVEIHHSVRLFWAAQARNAPWAVTSHTFEQSTFHTVMDYSFESDHQKVLIVCPVAPQTFVTSSGGGEPIDTGADIGDYRMFNSTGFVGALERNCLDR